MAWRLVWPAPQAAGNFPQTGVNNFARGGAPATDVWGRGFQLAVRQDWTNRPAPLLYPKGDPYLVGVMATQGYAAPAIVAPKGYTGTAPLALQQTVETTAPWDTPTDEIPGGGQGVGF